LSVEGRCPEAAKVVQALAFAGLQVALVAPAEARVVDLGARYRIAWRGDLREREDPARLCEERANVAAVMIAMSLRPPKFARRAPPALPPPPPPPPPPVEPEPVRSEDPVVSTVLSTPPPSPILLPAPAKPVVVTTVTAPAAPKTPRRVRVELDASLVGALAPIDNPPLAAGFELRLAIGGDRFAALIGAGAYTPATQSLDLAQAVTVRAPFDLGVRASLSRGRLRPSLDLGLVLGLLSIEGREVARPESALRLDVGLRVAPSLRVRLHDKVALVISLPVTVSFITHELEVLPSGVRGETPRVWLGLNLGVGGRLH
jgi:hypothetical protein